MKGIKKDLVILFIFSLLLQALFSSCSTTGSKKTYMRKAYKKIRRSVKKAEVTTFNDTVKVLFPANLMFESDSFTIPQKVMPTMKRFANSLNKFDKTAILITGYTDSSGNVEYNNKLSILRAETAKATLESFSVQDNRIKTWGLGHRYPVATNTTKDGRAKNRRVEFVILYEEKSK